MSITLITNNEELYHSVMSGEYIDGSSLDVLIHVRGLVHSGSRILTHPLCGSLRPNHQPYRSVIADVVRGLTDLDSLTVIESAISVYQSAEIIAPGEIPEETRADYAYIDAEIMRDSLGHYGLIRDESLCDAPSLLLKEVLA